MPNWVYNSVVVSGTRKDLQEFLDKATTPRPDTYDTDKKEIVFRDKGFSFWNFIAPPQKAVESGEYFGTHGYENGKQVGDTKNNWYNWNNANWGTKWDACDVDNGELSKGKKKKPSDTDSVKISFSTAWSIPEPVFTAMTKQHPTLDFEFYSEEETGWGAEYSGQDGSLTLEKEFSEPSCHSDYVERDNEDGCICSWDDDKDNWYDDCPDKESQYVVLVERRYKVEVSANSPELAWEAVMETENTGEADVLVVVLDEAGNRLYPKLD